MAETTYTSSDRFIVLWPYTITDVDGKKTEHFQVITSGPMEHYIECISNYVQNEVSKDLESISRKPSLYKLRVYQMKDGETFEQKSENLIFDSSNIDHLRQLKLGHYVIAGNPLALPGNMNVRQGHENLHRIETEVFDKLFTILFK